MPVSDVEPVPRPLQLEDLETRAVLILLEDRRLFESMAVLSALEAGPEARRALALALGRIGDPQGREALEKLLFDEAPAVRRAAAFGLGRLQIEASVPALTFAVRDEDESTAVWAVDSLLALEQPLSRIEQALMPLEPQDRWRRLLPGLFRSRDVGKILLASQALEHGDLDLRRLAAYAVSREPLPEALPLLRRLVADDDDWIRSTAIRGLGAVGDGMDLPRIEPALAADSEGVLIQTLRAAVRLIDEGKAVAPDSWRGRLLELAASDRPGVRLTALMALGSWRGSPEAESALIEAFKSGGRGAEVALASLGRGGFPALQRVLGPALTSDHRGLRVAAVRAAGSLGMAEDLLVLVDDEDAWVRAAAFEELVVLEPLNRPEWLRLALLDGDAAVRAMSLERLIEKPEVPFEEIHRAMTAPGSNRLIEVRTAGVGALVARAEAEALERGAIIAQLEGLAADPEVAVRRLAVSGLETLGRPRPAASRSTTARDLEWYREILSRLRQPVVLSVETDRGAFRMRLSTDDAPLTAVSFLQLAEQGYFDGLSFHRVVPDFVVQAGDPRGDGWGGPGYTLRDELSPIAYRAGTVGLALSGPDTGGSQFFVTLGRQPHLDGRYPVFAEVIDSLELLGELEQGDLIHSIRVVEDSDGNR